MKHTILTSAVLLAISPALQAQERFNLDDVVVTAVRSPMPKEAVIADVTVIDREEIERAGVSSLTNLLSRQPGVQISANGGVGTVSSVFLRGAANDQIVVLIDGMRLSSATLGTTAFENLPLAQIERIEILRGPASSLYGADAIGGVIQIFTRKSTSDNPTFHAAAGIGSYQTKTAEAGVSGKSGNTAYALNVSSYDTESFSALRTRANTKDRDDDAYNNRSVSGQLTHTFVPGQSLGVQFFESKGHNNFDGFNGTGNFDDHSNQTLQSYAITSKNALAKNWLSTLRLGESVDKSNSTQVFGRSTFKTTQTQFTWQHDFTLPLGHLTFAIDKLEQRVRSSNSYAKTKRSNDAFLLNYYLNAGQHSVNASIREDHNSQYGNYTTGGLGYAYRLTPTWKLSASYGSAFRSPTFNQLYFPFFGNPDLAPEESDNIELAAAYQGKRFEVSATAFQNKVRNFLANIGPAAGTCTFDGFCPANIGKVEMKGITFEGNWDITDNLELNGNFTVQSPKAKVLAGERVDQLLVRRGQRYGTLSLLHTLNDWQWGAEMTGASERYNDQANRKRMPGYVLFNLTANYQINPTLKLEARANNLFDKGYILAFSSNGASAVPYNTMGSNVFIGLRYDMQP